MDVNWKSSNDSLDYYKRSLDTALGFTPIVFPYKALWSFGGYARVVVPGLLITIVGMAGGMKTAFIEMLTERWRQMAANDVMWWGTEWDWMNMSDRAIQRYGGATLEQKALHTLWLHEKRDDKELSKRMGRELPKEIIDVSKGLADRILSWPGQNHMTEEIVSDLDLLLEAQADHISELRRAGREVKFCVWDYLQLLDLSGAHSESERLSNVMGKLSTFTAKQHVVGITASQVTKNAAYAAKKEDESLRAESGQNFRSDKPKLVITLRPIQVTEGTATTAEIVVDKNNAGRSGKKLVRIDPARYRWLDDDDKVILPF